MSDLEKCSKVFATNDAAVVVSWRIYLDQGGDFDKDKNCVYSSENETVKNSITIDLKDCLTSGDHFYVFANVKAGDDSKIGPYEYDSSSTHILSVELHGSAFKTHIEEED